MAPPSDDAVKMAQSEQANKLANLMDYAAGERSIHNKIMNQEGSQSENIASLERLKKTRMATLNAVRDIYVDETNALKGNTRVLVDKITTNELMKHQINEAEKELDVLMDNRMNKERLVKLGDYEHDRFRSHKNILKVVTYGALAILLILMAMTNIPFFPDTVGVFAIFLIMCVIVYSVLSRVYNNFRRRGHNWNKFNYSRYSKNEPIRKTTDDENSSGDSDANKCSALGWTAPAADVTFTIQKVDENFTTMVNPETLSKRVEPSNTSDYEKYPALF